MKGFLVFGICIITLISSIAQPISLDENAPLAFGKDALPYAQMLTPYNFKIAIIPSHGKLPEHISPHQMNTLVSGLNPSFTISFTEFPTTHDQATISRGEILSLTESEIAKGLFPVKLENFSSYIHVEEQITFNSSLQHFLYNDVLFFSFSLHNDSIYQTNSLKDYISRTKRLYPYKRGTVFFISTKEWGKKEEDYFGQILIKNKDQNNLAIINSNSPSSTFINGNCAHHFYTPEKSPSISFISFTDKKIEFSEILLSDLPQTQLTESSCLKLTAELAQIQFIKSEVLIDMQQAVNVGYIHLRIHNPTNYPVNFKADFAPHDRLFPSVGEIETILYPHSEKTLYTQLKTLEALNDQKDLLLEWNWQASIEFTDRPTITLKGNYPIPLVPSSLDLTAYEQLTLTKDSVIKLNTFDGQYDIRYTLDGTTPDHSSPLYTDSLHIKKPCLLKTRAFYPGGGMSLTDSCSFSWYKKHTGIRYEYYPYDPEKNIEEIPFILSNTTPLISDITTSWETQIPACRNHHYALKYTGIMHIPQPGNYQLDFQSSQQIILYLNERLIPVSQNQPVSLELSQGKNYLQLLYLHQTGPKDLNCTIEGPGMQKQPLPFEWFSPN